MLKLVFDADGLIKLAKAGILVHTAEKVKCLMTKTVFEEVMRGKEKMYEDTFIIEGLVAAGIVAVSNVASSSSDSLGAGEISAFSLFHESGADAIVSDDRKFISYLEEQGVPFIIPTDLITLLGLQEKIPKPVALQALEKLKPIVRKSNYEEARKLLGGK